MAQGYSSEWAPKMFSVLANIMAPDPSNKIKASLMAAQREAAYADAGYADARTLRSEQYRGADTTLADLLADPALLATPEGRARLAGAAAMTENGLQFGPRALGGSAAFIRPDLPGLDTIMVGTGNVNDYANTPGGFAAGQALERDKYAAENTTKLKDRELANAGAREVATINAGGKVDAATVTADGRIQQEKVRGENKAAGVGGGGGRGDGAPKWTPDTETKVYNYIADVLKSKFSQLEEDPTPEQLSAATQAARTNYEATGDLHASALAGIEAMGFKVVGEGWFNGKTRLEAAPKAMPQTPAAPAAAAPGAKATQVPTAFKRGDTEYRFNAARGIYMKAGPGGKPTPITKEEYEGALGADGGQ